ncbi:carboxyl transferase domain-containing protein, partial [Kineococcus glutinatus]|uniref:carboxyl transferase domain-containing protein n=1 Tax=Kineococcus glutinatus TaxID=1070872 RepID=UPI0031E7F51F
AGADRAARFVRTCDAFGVPVVTLVDTPGPAEAAGEAAATARLLHAYAAATVPLVTVLTGQVHGPASLALGSRHVGADHVIAWPRARIALRDPLEVAAALHDATPRTDPADAEERWYRDLARLEELATPAAALAAGDVDAVVAVADTRERLTGALRLLQRKAGDPPARKHANPPW